MTDMVCPLLDLPDDSDLLRRLDAEGIEIRFARPYERTKIETFVKERFNQGITDEVSTCFGRHPITLIIAVDRNAENKVIGYAAYECTFPGCFGPTGVDEAYRGRGIGKALCVEAMVALRSLGYIYGFIGWPGPVDFYRKNVGAIRLPEEWTTIYQRNDTLTRR